MFLHSKYAVSGDFSQAQQTVGIVWAVQIKTLDHVGQHDLLNALGCENADFLAKIRIGESLPALRFLDCVQLPCRELASTFWVAAHEESAEKEQN